MNKEYFLITTSEKNSWRYNLPILFLGDWCNKYEDKFEKKKNNVKVANYHWDDRNKLYNDYKYLRKIYEKIIS